MKRLNTLLYTLITLFFFASLGTKAQDLPTDYYYSNFEENNLGNRFTQIGLSSALEISSSSPLAGGYSLVSTGVPTAGGLNLSFLPAGTNIRNTEWGYEWTFLYRNNGGNPDNANTIDNGENAWKYWLLSDNPNQNVGRGYYITQEGNTLHLRYQDGNSSSPNNFCSYSISNNTTYAIRAQFVKKSNSDQLSIFLFVDVYDGTSGGAKTRRGNTGWEWNGNNPAPPRTYNNSSLMVSSTTANRFVFDEMKVYSMKLLIYGANEQSYGISTPLYAGQQNAVLYGLQLQTRGLFEVNQLRLDFNANVAGSVLITGNTGKLYKSYDAYFGNADDIQVTSLNVNWGEIQTTNFNPKDVFCTTGNDDGTIKTAQYYYVTVNVRNDASNQSFSIIGAPTLVSENTSINYSNNTNVVVNTSTGNNGSGKIFDWKGTSSSDWNLQTNWSPNNQGVPGENDAARIGVSQTFNYQPKVSGDRKVGNIIVGTANAVVPILDIESGSKLTVKNLFENVEGMTIRGAGVLEVLGSYIAKPTTSSKITKSEIATFNVSNLVLNGQSQSVGFNSTGANILVKNALQTSGANAATFTLGSGSVLTLTGASPFSLAASTNTITFDNNSTVVYGAAVNQTVNTALLYKNISFSGTGTKQAGAGTLNVSGNWNSAGGKVNLTSGTVSFNGANQTITDDGSDNDNGIIFGNISVSGGTKTLAGSGKFALAVGRFLTLAANTILQTSDKLTLKASSLGSASVSAIPSSSSVQGNVTVERYVQGGAKDMWRSYRMFSSPIYDNNNSSNRTYSFTQFIDNMLITGKSAGFDQINNSATGAWTYNNGFIAIPNINTAVDVGRGAYILYRGDRTNGAAKVSVPYVDPESIIMDFKGKLNQQDVHVPLTHGSTTFSFLGNPYAATIDWTLVQKSNVEATIRIWNPEKKQYATHNGQHGINGGARYIGPGQGFFVQTTSNSSPYVTFTENSKVSNVAQSVPLYNKVMSVRDNTIGNAFSGSSNFVEEEPVQIRVKLQRDGFENQDETLVLLQKNELATLSGYDVERTGGEAVFLSSLSAEGRKMAINYMPHISTLSVVNLDVNMSNNGNYKMTIDLTDVPLGYELKLRDKFLNTFTDLSASGTTYTLTADKAQATTMGDRFEILISPPKTLPVVFTEFSGSKTNQGVSLKWKTSSEQDNNRFEIRRAGEEQIFTTIGTVVPNSSGTYQLLDASPLSGSNYYKLYQIDNDGKSAAHNKVVVVKHQLNENISSQLSVYPTVVETSYTVKFNGDLNTDRFVMKLTDITGKEVSNKVLSKAEIFNGYSSDFPATSAGIYFATLVDLVNGNQLGMVKIIKK